MKTFFGRTGKIFLLSGLFLDNSTDIDLFFSIYYFGHPFSLFCIFASYHNLFLLIQSFSGFAKAKPQTRNPLSLPASITILRKIPACKVYS